MPAMLVLVGIGLYWIYGKLSNHNFRVYKSSIDDLWKGFRIIALIGFIWTVAIGFNYYFILSPGIASEHMQNYHKSFFLDVADLSNVQSNVLTYIRLIGKKTLLGMTTVGVLLLLGIFRQVRTKDARAIYFLTPIMLTIVLSMMGKYSLIERLLFFLLPIFLVIIAEGLTLIYTSVGQAAAKYSLLAAMIVGLTITFRYRHGAKWLKYTPLEDLKSVAMQVDQQQNGLPMYFSKHAYPSYHHYRYVDQVLQTDRVAIKGTKEHELYNEIADQIQSDTFYIMLSHVINIKAEANQVRIDYVVIEEYQGKGTFAFLVEKK